MVSFRPLREADFEQLADWLGRDHVQTWWREPSASSTVAQKYGPRVRGESPTEVFVVVLRGRDVGIVQRYRIVDHPDWLGRLGGTGIDASEAAGIDYLLGDPQVIGQGVGTEMIGAFTAKLFADLNDVTSVVAAPQAANTASRRALEKAGYELRWGGVLDSDDPSDEGESALYVKSRPS